MDIQKGKREYTCFFFFVREAIEHGIGEQVQMDVRKHLSRIGWAYVVFLIVSEVAQVAAICMFRMLQRVLPMEVLNQNTLVLISQAAMYGAGFPVFWLLMRRIPSWQMAEQKQIEGRRMFLMLIISFGLIYIGNMIGQIFMALTGQLTGIEGINPLMETLDDMNLVVVFLSTVIIAPIMEELMFRKFLIDRIVPLGQKTAVIISGLGFGLFHGNFYQFFYAAILGMMFAYVYSYTGKIKYTIMLHMCVNFVGGVLSLVLMREEAAGSDIAAVLSILLGFFVIGSIASAIGFMVAKFRKLVWFEAWEYPEKGVIRALLTAPGIWAFFLINAATFIFMTLTGHS